jgi:ribosome recycling factor
MLEDLMKDAKERMHGAVDSLDHDLAGFRTGRASTALVDRIEVDYYGNPTPLLQMATISAPEPRLIAIRPWDQSALKAIEKALNASDLGINPSNDGQVIRIPIPPLTEDRREELVRMASRRAEEARIAIRNVRRDVIHDLDGLDLPEDDLYRAKERVQKATDRYVEEIDAHLERKTIEIREI